MVRGKQAKPKSVGSKPTGKAANLQSVSAKKASQVTSANRPSRPKPRQLKITPYKSFRLQKRIKSPDEKIASSFQLFGRSVAILAKNWPVFVGILVVYFVLSVLVIGSLSAIDSSSLSSFKQSLVGNFNGVLTGVALFSFLAGSSNFGGSQVLLGIFVSLAIIWALRQVNLADRTGKIRVRDSFYKGMDQLTPFILVLVVIALELIPLALGAFLYSAVVSGGIAITSIEKLSFGIISFLLALASFYMITSSIFATYIATLKNMTPVRALRAAVELIKYRRARIFLKIIFIFLALLIAAAIIVIPLAVWATPVAPYAFFILTLIFLIVFHSYMYALYRELI
jgi:hypothetical protein